MVARDGMDVKRASRFLLALNTIQGNFSSRYRDRKDADALTLIGKSTISNAFSIRVIYPFLTVM